MTEVQVWSPEACCRRVSSKRKCSYLLLHADIVKERYDANHLSKQ